MNYISFKFITISISSNTGTILLKLFIYLQRKHHIQQLCVTSNIKLINPNHFMQSNPKC